MTRNIWWSFMVLGMAAHGVRAQPAFEKKGDAADVKDVTDVTWTAKGDVGLVSTTGNAASTTLTVGANAVRKDQDNKVEATLTSMYARATTRVVSDANGNGVIDNGELTESSSTSANNLAGKLRYDRYLTPADALYVAALAGYDKAAGKDFMGGGQVGYSRQIYKQATHEVMGEVGYDVSYVRLTAGDTSTIHSARLFAGYKGALSKDTALEASGEALINASKVTYGMREASLGEATRLIGIVSVTTALSTKISLAASFTAKYDRFPAPLAPIGGKPFAPGYEPTAEALDTITKIALIVKFL